MTDRTRLYFGDCLDGLERLGAGLATLAYLDPPFSVGTDFRARLRGGEVRAHGKATSGRIAYEDRFDSLDVFLGWLGERISRLRDVLSEEGTMWVHLDHRAIHETKVLCDRIFGRDQFLGEVIWTPGNGAKGRRKPSVTHQTLLIYAKGRDFVWNADAPELREPFAPTSLSMHFTNIDDSGRRYRERSVGGKSYRYYADEGRAMGSVWTDCPAMQCNTPLRKETTGYPTQKPLRLLERIVCASSRPGDLVVDPFCGSGTTLLAALEQGRLAFGCDVGELAVQISSNRIESHGYRVSVLRSRKGTVRSLGASRALPRV